MRRSLLLLSLPIVAAFAGEASAQQSVNPMHPSFVPLDAQGQPARASDAVSGDKTCGGCHDVGFVAAHTDHAREAVGARSCLACHVDGGRLDVRPEMLEASGQLRRDALRIGKARAGNCAPCHGIVAGAGESVAVPADFARAEATGTGRARSSLTAGEGAIVSPEPMAASFLNLQGKESLRAPWDVHAAKLVECSACHPAGNDPARPRLRSEAVRSLVNDPRRPTTAEFLARPDHRLASADCRSCHDPMEAHEFLPYRTRHLEALACQTCHIPAPRGPVVEMVDATVVTLEGDPVVRYRNVERGPGETLNTAVVRPFRPLVVARRDADGVERLRPLNLTSRWRWSSGGVEVPFERVARAWLDEAGEAYAPEVLTSFDANHDGALDEAELRLDSEGKVERIAARLKALGVAAPAVEGAVEAHPLAHGVVGREGALRACEECHGPGSRLAGGLPLAPFLPGGATPKPPEEKFGALGGTVGPDGAGGLRFEGGLATGGWHVLGLSRHAWTNELGFVLFAAVILGCLVHAGARFATRKRAAHRPTRGPKTYVFGLYERIWHWTMAASGTVLLATGVAIHAAGEGSLLGLPSAVRLHNLFAVVLMANAFLALFYHLSTAAIRQFIPAPRGLLARVMAHLEYYGRGIFVGAPHPKKEAGHKLNPLQQLTYLALLNVLFPVQIGTGLLIWAVGHWPRVAATVGGLQYVAPLHNLGAWLFLSFFALHLYLITTGPTVAAHLRSMISGYEVLESDDPSPQELTDGAP